MLTYTVSGILSAWIIKMLAESLIGQLTDKYQPISNENISELLLQETTEQPLYQNGTSDDTKDVAFNVIMYSYVLNGLLQIFAGLLCVVVAVCATGKLKG